MARITKTVTFSIRPLSDVADDFTKAFDAVRTSRRVPKNPHDEVGFTSIEAARNFLIRERLALMRDDPNPSSGLALRACEDGRARL
jgi:hypothetical protein